MVCDLEIRGECGSRRFQDISVYIYFIHVFDNRKEVRQFVVVVVERQRGGCGGLVGGT